jgi:mRNA interferase HigB
LGNRISQFAIAALQGCLHSIDLYFVHQKGQIALRETFGAADYVDGYTIFDAGGNRYRIAAVIHYDKQHIYVRDVMTHAEYDRNAWGKR